MKNYIITVDIGTGGCKSILFDDRYHQISSSQVAYPRKTFGACLGEQDPDELLSIFQESLKRCIAQAQINHNQIKAMGLSASPYAFLGVDRDGAPVIPISWWGDKKILTKSEANSLTPILKELYGRTGCPFSPSFPFARLLWLSSRQSKTLYDIHKILSIKSYVIYTLTNKWVEDISTASGTGLLNLRDRCWDPSLTQVLHLREDTMGDLVSPYYIAGTLADDFARQCGIRSTFPIVTGCSDATAASLGTHSMKLDKLCINLGFTASLLRASRAMPIFDQEQRFWYNLLDEDNYVWGGTSNSGGALVKWFVQNFFSQGIAGQLLEKEMARRFTKPVELSAYPYFWGERTPFWNPHLTGTFLGLTFNHTSYDILYALMEGICFNLYYIFELMEDSAGTCDGIRLTGGAFHWKFFSQFFCDLFGVSMEVPEFLEGTALGTAAIVRKALGLSINEDALLKASDYNTINPRDEISKNIREKYQAWKNSLEDTVDFLIHNIKKDDEYLDFTKKYSARHVQRIDAAFRSSLVASRDGKGPAEQIYIPEMQQLPPAERKTLEPLKKIQLPDLKPEDLPPPPPPAPIVYQQQPQYAAPPQTAVPPAAPQYAAPPAQHAAPQYAVPQAQHAAPQYAVPQAQHAAPPGAVIPPAQHAAPQYAAAPPAQHAAPQYAVPQAQHAAPPGAVIPPAQHAAPPGAVIPPAQHAAPPGAVIPPAQHAAPQYAAAPPAQHAAPPGAVIPPAQHAAPPGTVIPPARHAAPPGAVIPPAQPPPSSYAAAIPPAGAVIPPAQAPPSSYAAAIPPAGAVIPPAQAPPSSYAAAIPPAGAVIPPAQAPPSSYAAAIPPAGAVIPPAQAPPSSYAAAIPPAGAVIPPAQAPPSSYAAAIPPAGAVIPPAQAPPSSYAAAIPPAGAVIPPAQPPPPAAGKSTIPPLRPGATPPPGMRPGAGQKQSFISSPPGLSIQKKGIPSIQEQTPQVSQDNVSAAAPPPAAVEVPQPAAPREPRPRTAPKATPFFPPSSIPKKQAPPK
ncbi:MAG: FGGY family carbohydrate kinase [Candidatus Xenobiia bacterium LiM19]